MEEGVIKDLAVLPDSISQPPGNHATEIETATNGLSLVRVATLPSGQTIQLLGPESDSVPVTEESLETQNHHEVLARRPSYRQILSDLSSPTDGSQTITVAKIEEDSDSTSSDGEATNLSTNGMGMSLQTPGLLQSQIKVLPSPTIQIAAHGDNSTQGLQTLTMSNASAPSSAVSPSGATIVQYAQSADGQFLIPAGNVQYQLAGTTGSLPQGVVMATSGGGLGGGQNSTEEASRKRELRLLKNREAARECRRKKKEYVKCLENRVAVLENQNKTLIEELKSLKELYCQKEVVQS